MLFMSTSCTICGNSHDTPRQSKNCEIRSRKVELENAEVVEYIMKLSLHTKIF